jgi:integrase
VFTGRTAPHVRSDSFRGVFARACSDAKIDPAPRVHDLRHTAVSNCIDLGYDVLAISEMVGHSTVITTLDTYGHLFKRLQASNVDKLDAALQGALQEHARP